MSEGILNIKDQKRALLDEFCKLHENANAQRSAEWYAMTYITFGGSEQSTLSGENKYEKIADLVAKKTGLVPNFGNIYTRWGVHLEKSVSKVVVKVFEVDMRELGAIPGPVRFSRCSPDGLGLMVLHGNWTIVLFEYKNPFRRVPTNSIPHEYIAQLKTGLCTIPIADTALFMDFITRACAQEDMHYTQAFNKKVHPTDGEHKKPIAMGNFIIYQTEEQREEFLLINKEDRFPLDKLILKKYNSIEYATELAQRKPTSSRIKKKIIDFGSLNHDDMDRLLELVEDDLVSIHQTYPIIFPWSVYKKVPMAREKFKDIPIKRDLDKYYAKLERKMFKGFQAVIECDCIILGVMGWKLFDWKIMQYDNKEPKFLQKQEAKMIDTMSVIQKIKDNPEKKWEIYHEYYPTKYKKNTDQGIVEDYTGDDLEDISQFAVDF